MVDSAGKPDVEDYGFAIEVFVDVVAGPNADLVSGGVVIDRDEGRAALGRRGLADDGNASGGRFQDFGTGGFLVDRREVEHIDILGQVVVDRGQRLGEVEIGIVDREVDAPLVSPGLLALGEILIPLMDEIVRHMANFGRNRPAVGWSSRIETADQRIAFHLRGCGRTRAGSGVLGRGDLAKRQQSDECECEPGSPATPKGCLRHSMILHRM